MPALTTLVCFISSNQHIRDLRIDMNSRLSEMRTGIDTLTGKVTELSDRMIRVEATLHIE